MSSEFGAVNQDIGRLSCILNDPKVKINRRIRALFRLMNIGGNQGLLAMKDAMMDSSVLLSHEVAYCLGQMANTNAIPYLEDVLQNENLNTITRHEAAEALGAIGDPCAIHILEVYKNSSVSELSETCQVAIDLINWKLKHPDFKPNSTFPSIDPAPPSKSDDIGQLKSKLLNKNRSTFKRYKALFKLRNINTKESILVICSAFGTGGPLFDHEIAFVLGQMGSSLAVPFLSKILKNESHHEMVRHEAAEALGAIPDDNTTLLLKEYINDNSNIIRESCLVALDMCEYYDSECFQYVDPFFENFKSSSEGLLS